MMLKKNYRIVQSSNYDCLVRCFEIILSNILNNKKGIDIQSYFNINIDQEDVYNSGVTVDINILNRILVDFKTSYRARYELANKYEDWLFEEELRQSLDKGNHIIATLSSSILYNLSNKDIGHAVLIYDYNSTGYIIIDTDTLEIYHISFETIYSATRQRQGGLIIIEPST